jgi:hypothetical protein
MWHFVKRHTARSTDDYLAEIDEYVREDGEQFLLVHLRVFKFTPRVLRRILTEWRCWRALCKQPLFACGEREDRTFQHFVKLLDFESLMPVVTECGEERTLYVSYPAISNERQFITTNPIDDHHVPVGSADSVP